MVKGLLKEEELKNLKEEKEYFDLMYDYLSKGEKEQEEFTSIRRMPELELADGSIKIPDILAMENKNGKIELLNKTSKIFKEDELEKIAKSTGMEKEDILVLIQDGMDVKAIDEKAEKLPFKNIADSKAIREMVRKEIDPKELELMKQKGIEVVALSNGDIQVKSIQKLAEIDEKGLVKLDQKLMENLKPFEEMGLIKLSQDLVVKEIPSKEMGKENIQGNKLKIISLDEKKKEMNQEELEKQKVAKDIGIDPDWIVSMIRLDDKQEGSRLINDKTDMNTTKYIIRTRSGAVANKFIVAEEKDDGIFNQIKGFEISSVGREVGALLHDTQGNHITSLKPGEIKSGKMNPMQNEYNYFQIRRAGESLDDGINQLLFVGTMGQTDMNVIENRDNGDKSFVTVPSSTVHPRNIYMEGSTSALRETHLHQDNEKPNCLEEERTTINFKDIEKRKELLERLEIIEAKIQEIESHTGHDERCINDCIEGDEKSDELKGKADMTEEIGDTKLQLPDLYSQRSTILTELGVNEKTAVKEIEDDEFQIGMPRRPR